MDVQRDESQGGGMRDRDVYPGGAWTPDSQALITSYGGKIMRVEVPSGETSEIPFTAHIQQDVGPSVKFDYPINDSVLTVSQIRGARPSPDGTRLVFSALDRLWTAPLPDQAGTQREGYPVITDARRLTTSTDVEHGAGLVPRRPLHRLRDLERLGRRRHLARPRGRRRRTREAHAHLRLLRPGGLQRRRLPCSPRCAAQRCTACARWRTSAATAPPPSSSTCGCPPPAVSPAGSCGSARARPRRDATHPTPVPTRTASTCGAGQEGLLSVRYDGTDIRVVVKVTAPLAPRTRRPRGSRRSRPVTRWQARGRAGQPQRLHHHRAAGGG